MTKIQSRIPKKVNRLLTIDDTNAIDEESRSITFSLSSEAAIEDWPGEYTILEHTESAVDLTRLISASPLLFNHDRNKHLGRVISAKIENGKLSVTAKFGNSRLANEKFQDVKDGILREVSVSAKIHEVKLDQSTSDGVETYRATKWEPLEASLVTVPADITVGIGRNESIKANDFILIEKNSMKEETLEKDKKSVGRESQENKNIVTFQTDPKVIEKERNAERERVSAINDLARKHNVEDKIVRDFVNEGRPLEAFQRHVLENLGAKEIDLKQTTELGLSRKEKEQYSLLRALAQQAEGKFDGLEAECSREMAKKLNRQAKGFFIPTDIATHKRNMTAGVAAQGGNTVQEDVLGTSLIELLRNKTMLNALGVRTLTGLQGNVAIPRVEGGATAYWLGETDEVTASDQDFGQVTLTPKRLVGDTAYSKQLLAQSSISVEAFVRDDLMRVLAIAKDLAGIAGTGASNQPTGILNTTGINTLTFTTAATFAKMIDFETAVATDNADVNTMAYLTTPSTRGKLKQTSVDTGSGVFIWSNNQVNGYRAEATNQVPGDRVIFGNFGDAMFGDWDGMDVVVDPYTLKKRGLIEVTITLLTDFAVRHPVSFCASTDAGNL